MAPRRPGFDAGSQGLAHKPIYTFETGGTTGIPKTRINIEELSPLTMKCSVKLCPSNYFPKGSNWLMLGPSGPRRLRLAGTSISANTAAGICFCADLDPRWVVKLIKKG